MKFYKLKILVPTEEAKRQEKLNPDADDNLNNYVTRDLYLNVECISAFYPHKNRKATMVETENSAFIVAIIFEKFEEMVFNKDFISVI